MTPQLITEILKENPCLENMFNNQLFNLSDENFATALNYISKINSEFEQDDSYSQYIIKNTLSELLMFICRHNDTSKLIIDKGDLRIQAVIDFILEHYPEHITLSDCAKIACMHYNTFSAVFQKRTGIIFYIDPVISVCQPDLSYVPRHGKRFLYCSLIFLVLLINDLYHLISPLQPQA